MDFYGGGTTLSAARNIGTSSRVQLYANQLDAAERQNMTADAISSRDGSSSTRRTRRKRRLCEAGGRDRSRAGKQSDWLLSDFFPNSCKRIRIRIRSWSFPQQCEQSGRNGSGFGGISLRSRIKPAGCPGRGATLSGLN